MKENNPLKTFDSRCVKNAIVLFMNTDQMHSGFFAFWAASLIDESLSISVADARIKTYLKACITLAIFCDTSRSCMHFSSRFSIVPSVMSMSMFVAYFFAAKVLKLSVFNSLGSICGGMTSTPALGTLIRVTKTDDVAAAYAATYPMALIFVVLCCQFIGILL